jgi:hypothetical protein
MIFSHMYIDTLILYTLSIPGFIATLHNSWVYSQTVESAKIPIINEWIKKCIYCGLLLSNKEK